VAELDPEPPNRDNSFPKFIGLYQNVLIWMTKTSHTLCCLLADTGNDKAKRHWCNIIKLKIRERAIPKK
jgi:hypothetical protein